MSYEPMNTAPRDGSPVLLKPRAGSGLKHPFVGRFHTGSEDWGFAAPVGFGGITDEWLDGWMALPPDGVTAAPERAVVAQDVQASGDPGAWTCGACGFRGFWHGGPHCMPGPHGLPRIPGTSGVPLKASEFESVKAAKQATAKKLAFFNSMVEAADARCACGANLYVDAQGKPRTKLSDVRGLLRPDQVLPGEPDERALTQREVDAIYALRHAVDWIGTAPHGDNCFVSSHYTGDPGNRCNCGKDSAEQAVHDALGGYPEAMDADGEPLEVSVSAGLNAPRGGQQ